MTPRVAEHSEDLGAAESADSAGSIGIGGGNAGDGESGCTDITEQEQKAKERSGPIEPAEVRRQGGVGSLEGIRKAKDTEVKPEKDRRDRRSTIEEEEDVEKRRMMTEATGGGRSIGSGETRKVNRDNRKRRKSRRRCAGQRLTLRHMAVREAETFRSGRKAGVLGKVGNGRSSKEKYGVVKGDEMKVRARAGTGTKNWKQERCRMGQGRPRKMSESSAEAETPRSEKGTWRGMKIDLNKVKVVEEVPESSAEAEGSRGRKRKSRMGVGKEPKPERELENCHVVEFGLGSETAQAGTGRKEEMWKETKDASQSSTKASEPSFPSKNRAKPDSAGSIKAEENSAKGQDRRWRTRIGEWNEKSRSLMDQCSISEARRFGVGVVATSERGRDLSRKILAESNGLETQRLVEGKVNAKSSKVGSGVGSGEIREEVGYGNEGITDEQEAAKGMGNGNHEKGRILREVHGEDPMGRTTRRKSSTCSETTNSDSASRRFGSEESEVRRCVRNRKSSAESVVGIRNPEVGSRIRNDKGKNRRMTAQEVLVQSESANSSSEEKSEIIGKARKFEMPIPPLRVDVPSSSARFQLLRGYRGLTRSFRPKVKGEKLGEPETRQQERSGCRSATGLMVDSSMRGSKGAEASDEVPEEPKHLTNQSREATGKTEANARMFGRVPMARAAEAEHDRKESPNRESPEGDDG
ncbi:hypothetical protein DFH06DRAFT_1139032 [Mycena polygramma]|nr:hypothetical protein DFH06DRAFT_1139032 [Mycena polygramma]